MLHVSTALLAAKSRNPNHSTPVVLMNVVAVVVLIVVDVGTPCYQ
jgi:hypothetical protein